jgi:hypothetical protein
MDRYRILPTDKRFKSISDELIELLFIIPVQIPSVEIFKDAYIKRKRKETEENKIPKESLKSMGYSEEDIEKISKDILSRGR